MPDDNSFYQGIAQQYTKEGPFSEMLAIGLHPALQQQQAPQNPVGVAGVAATLADSALRGLQRGRLLNYLMSEAQKKQQYDAGLQEFDDKIREIDANPDLTDEDKFAQKKAVYENSILYRNAHFHRAWQEANGDTGTDGKKKKPSKKDAGGASSLNYTPANFSPVSQQQKSGEGQTQDQQGHVGFAQRAGAVLSDVAKRILGPNLPVTPDGFGLDWVKARNVDVDQIRAGAPGALLQKRQEMLNGWLKDMKDMDQNARRDYVLGHNKELEYYWGKGADQVKAQLISGGLTFEENFLQQSRKDATELQEQPLPSGLPSGPPPKPREAPPSPTAANFQGGYYRPTATGTVTIPMIPPGSKQTTAQLAYRNNNPFNIKWTKGHTMGEGGFNRYETPEEGYREGIEAIKRGINKGETIAEYITRKSPPSENPTGAMISKISGDLGVTPMTMMSAVDPEQFGAAQMAFESGAKYTPGAGFMQAGSSDNASPAMAPGQYAQADLSQFQRGLPSGYTAAVREYFKKYEGFEQESRWLTGPNGEDAEIIQITPYGRQGAKFIDPQSGEFIDVAAAQKAGFRLGSRRDPMESFQLVEGADHTMYQVDRRGTLVRQVKGPDGKPFQAKDYYNNPIVKQWEAEINKNSAAIQKIDEDFFKMKQSIGRLAESNPIVPVSELQDLGISVPQVLTNQIQGGDKTQSKSGRVTLAGMIEVAHKAAIDRENARHLQIMNAMGPAMASVGLVSQAGAYQLPPAPTGPPASTGTTVKPEDIFVDRPK